MQQPNKKRPACTHCLRPQRTCICHWITPVEHAIEVVILQHSLEVANAKGSARLLHLCLPRSRLMTGEIFDEQALKELLYAPWHLDQAVAMLPDHAPQYPVLLYPDTPDAKAIGIAPAPLLEQSRLQQDRLRLIVLDGTWRKSRKMLYSNPLLQQLPRLPLRNLPASHYTIRKAHHPDQLSTMEAACYALMQLEQDSQKYQPLLNAFDGFVAQQAGYRVPE